eukprot:TRINITY_DN606_c2_g1_i1.p1 TRINITY_DN606_c2_g1~~TRINITY_DN606_c2_g1_i1.p1  ORF type:complete len:390 (-),score=38.72 TRINITY_DN606_c2_g1_i1:1082-2251(-)
MLKTNLGYDLNSKWLAKLFLIACMTKTIAAQFIPVEMPNLDIFADDENPNIFNITVPEDSVADCTQELPVLARSSALEATAISQSNEPCRTSEEVEDFGQASPLTVYPEVQTQLTDYQQQPLVAEDLQIALPAVSQNISVSVQGTWWKPLPGLSWQFQLQGRIATMVQADVFILNLFEMDDQITNTLKSYGRKIICHFSVGVYANWNEDAKLFDERMLGRIYSGWPSERWIDIRATQQLYPIMAARLDRAVQRQCDGVLLNHLDAFDQDTGFALIIADQVNYNNWLAKEAHARGLSVGLQNAQVLLQQMEPVFDFAVVENCNQEQTCELYRLFVENNKAVFAVEYPPQLQLEQLTWAEIQGYCSGAIEAGLSGIIKRLDKFEARIPCTV